MSVKLFLAEIFENAGYELHMAGDIPGFTTLIDTGREGPTIAVFGELDSVICASHPEADPETGAVHTCGHNCQAAALLGLAAMLKEPGALEGMDGKILLGIGNDLAVAIHAKDSHLMFNPEPTPCGVSSQMVFDSMTTARDLFDGKINAIAAVVLFLVFTSLIGVCASAEMRCQVTKVWGMGAAAAVFASSLINLLSGKEGQIPG